MRARGGEHRIRAHRLRIGTGGRCGRLAVVHRHDVHAVEHHAGPEGGPHHVQAVGREAVGQDGQRVPDLQAGTGLLEQLERVAAESDCGRIGYRRTFDVEVEAVERVGIHDAGIGLGQIRRGPPARRIPLGEARAGRPAERDHHVAPRRLKRADRLVDRDGLLVGGGGRERGQARPGRRAIGSGLDEAEGHQRHAPGAGDFEEVWHGPHAHVDVGGEVGLAPLLVTGVAGVDSAGRKGGRGRGRRIRGWRWDWCRRRRGSVGERAGDEGGGRRILAGEVRNRETRQRHALEAVGLLHRRNPQHGAPRLVGEPQFAAGEPVEGEDVGRGMEVGDREVLIPRPGDREGSWGDGGRHRQGGLRGSGEHEGVTRAGGAHREHGPGLERFRGELPGLATDESRHEPPLDEALLAGRRRQGQHAEKSVHVHDAPP